MIGETVPPQMVPHCNAHHRVVAWAELSYSRTRLQTWPGATQSLLEAQSAHTGCLMMVNGSPVPGRSSTVPAGGLAFLSVAGGAADVNAPPSGRAKALRVPWSF